MKKNNQRRKAYFFKKAGIAGAAIMICICIGALHPTIRENISKYSRLLYIHAASLEEAEQEKQSLEEKKKETEKKIKKLEKKKSNILEYIEELDTQVAERMESIL